MIRYIGGIELKFIVNEDMDKSLMLEKLTNFLEFAKLWLYFPIQHKKALIEKLEKIE